MSETSLYLLFIYLPLKLSQFFFIILKNPSHNHVSLKRGKKEEKDYYLINHTGVAEISLLCSQIFIQAFLNKIKKCSLVLLTVLIQFRPV